MNTAGQGQAEQDQAADERIGPIVELRVGQADEDGHDARR